MARHDQIVVTLKADIAPVMRALERTGRTVQQFGVSADEAARRIRDMTEAAMAVGWAIENLEDGW